jgi:NitT/TauT family transport system permease protein
MAPALRSIVLRTGSIVVLLLLWWIASRLMHDPDVLPGPLVIGDTIAHNLATPGPEGKSAFFHIGITLARIFVAFTASMLLGIAIGLAMGLSRLLERSLLVVIPLMLTMPTILMVFVAVMWFGFSEAGGLVAVMAVVSTYVALNILEGTKSIDNSLVEMGLTFKANRSLLFR